MALHDMRDPEMVRDINLMWLSVYPGLAAQVAELCPRPPRRILEVGCFSGGTGLSLLDLFPDATLTVALELPTLAANFTTVWEPQLAQAGAERVRAVATPLSPLTCQEQAFDLVFSRGVYFFFDDQGTILQELWRVCAPGGVVVAGGGFGSHTPRAVIDALQEDSRRKNNDLGRRLYTVEEVRGVVARAGLDQSARIVEEGGLWIVLSRA